MLPTCIVNIKKVLLRNYIDENRNIVIKVQLIVALIGILLLIIGVFSPFVHATFIGTIPYTQVGKYYDEIIIALCILAFIITLLGLYRWLLVPACGSLGVLVFSIYNIYQKIENIRLKIEEKFYNNLYKDILTSFLDYMEQSMAFQWGIILILTGILFVVISALLNTKYSIIISRSLKER